MPRGLSVSDIEEQLREVYRFRLSESAISRYPSDEPIRLILESWFGIIIGWALVYRSASYWATADTGLFVLGSGSLRIRL